MGIISDIFEESRGIGWEPADGVPLKPISLKDKTKIPSLIECPVCGSKMPSEDLNNHIKEAHANRYIYVLANGFVVTENAYIDDKLNNLDIVPLGIKDVRLEIAINQNNVAGFVFSKKTSLFRYIKGFESGQINLKVHLPSGEREFFVYFGGAYKFDNKIIDKAALDDLFWPLHEKQCPDYESFKKNYMMTISKKPEHRYADSLYDYALGFDLSTSGDNNAKQHFESALSHLRTFKTPTAITARRVLALRMNSFKFLKDCQFPSRFAIANFFFNSREARFVLPSSHEINSDSAKKPDFGVYIDDFTNLFIDALSAYYCPDFDMLDIICQKLAGLIMPNDRNNMDKLRLLEARAAFKKGDFEKAKTLYSELTYHPLFGDEAREIIRENFSGVN